MPTATDVNSTKMNSAGEKSKMVHLTTKDQLNSFEVSVFQYKNNPTEKNLATVEKTIQVLSKKSDVSQLTSNKSLLIDLKWLVGQTPPFMPALALLTKIALAVPQIRPFYRDSLRLMSTLTNALMVTSDTNNGKISKILDLMRYVAHGIEINRIEAFLHNLIPKLIGFVTCSETTFLSNGLSILVSLSYKNYVVVRHLLSIITEEDRKKLLEKYTLDKKFQVFGDFFEVILSSTKLSSMRADSIQQNVARVGNLTDAFCMAYNEEDCITLLNLIDFLTEITSHNSEVKIDIISQVVHKICNTADFSEGSHYESNELLLRFFRRLILFPCDYIYITEMATKTVALRLESKATGSINSKEAICLINDVLTKLDKEREELSSTSLQNIRLQLDSVVPTLCDVVSNLESTSVTDDRIETLAITFDTLVTVAKNETWIDLISTRIAKPYLIIDMIKRLADLNIGKCFGILISKFFSLSQIISQSSTNWQSAMEVLLSDETVLSLLTRCLQMNCHPESSADILQAIAKCNRQDNSSKCDISTRTGRNLETQLSQQPELCLDVTQLKEALDENIRMLQKSFQAEEMVCQTIELMELRILSQSGQLETLKSALTAADERISHQNIRAIQLEEEVSRYNQLTKGLWQKIDSLQREITEIKNQYLAFQATDADFRRKAQSEIRERESQVSSLLEDQERLLAKTNKYKEQAQALQDTIKDYQRIRSELEDKLKFEGKMNHDLTITLTKREKELRKKERQLEEEMSEREKLAKEVDRLNKEVTSLQSLSKGQEQALAKKDKQLQDQQEEINDMRKIHEQIFNLSKKVSK